MRTEKSLKELEPKKMKMSKPVVCREKTKKDFSTRSGTRLTPTNHNISEVLNTISTSASINFPAWNRDTTTKISMYHHWKKHTITSKFNNYVNSTRHVNNLFYFLYCNFSTSYRYTSVNATLCINFYLIY